MAAPEGASDESELIVEAFRRARQLQVASQLEQALPWADRRPSLQCLS